MELSGGSSGFGSGVGGWGQVDDVVKLGDGDGWWIKWTGLRSTGRWLKWIGVGVRRQMKWTREGSGGDGLGVIESTS